MSRRVHRSPAAASPKPALARIALLRERIEHADTYPFDIPVIAALDVLDVLERVLFLVGENGSGKSTFLEALALASGFAAEGGTRNFRPPSRMSANRSVDDAEAPVRRLADALRLSWTERRQPDGFFLRTETFHDFASHLDRSARENEFGPGYLGSYGGASLHDRSHGESFLTLFLTRFSSSGFFLLDEPEAALSAARQLSLLVRMHDLMTDDTRCQFVIATHSPILLAFPGAQIVSFDGSALREITYRETDAYNITRRFLSDPDGMLRRLFERDRDARSS